MPKSIDNEIFTSLLADIRRSSESDKAFYYCLIAGAAVSVLLGMWFSRIKPD